MGIYVKKIYIDKRDVYAVLALGLIGYARYINYPLPYVNYDRVLIVAGLFLLAKSFILPAHDSIIFIVFLSTLLLSLFLPFFQVLLFAFLSLFFLRLFRTI